MPEEIRQTDLPDVLALAYLGDAVFSLAVREMLVLRGISRSGELNRLSLAYVTAEAQSDAFLQIEPTLSELERSVARRAGNSSHLNHPHHTKVADYRRATGLEAIFGMLEVTGRTERKKELLTEILGYLSAREASLPRY